MANPFTTTVRRCGLGSASALALVTIGCAFPHGRYGGDPMCGNFNRPIAPTPPVWSGGDPGMSPAYDGETRLGMPPPDVRPSTSTEKVFIMPTYGGGLGMSGLFRGGAGSASSGSSGDSSIMTSGRRSGGPGARLPALGEVTPKPALSPLGNTPGSANGVSYRSMDAGSVLTSGSSIVPNFAPAKPLTAIDAMKDPAKITSVEEGQSVLTTCGAKAQKLEMEPTGEWRFVCTLGDGGDGRRYEARHTDQLEALRAVMFQVQKDK